MSSRHNPRPAIAWPSSLLFSAMSVAFVTGACSVEPGRDAYLDDDRDLCNGWAQGRCGRPDGCFADPGTCEVVYGALRTCTAGNWNPADSCDGGGGECLPWSSARCGRPSGCYAPEGTCEDIYGGPRNCTAGNWNPVAACGGGDGGDSGGDAAPLPDYGVALDPGSMVNPANGHVWFHDNAIYDLPADAWHTNFELMQLSGAQYVRVNFIRPAGFSDNAWLELYDPLIDELLDEGIHPYALVGREAVTQAFPAPWLEQQGGSYVAVYPTSAQADWIDDHYAPTFADVVEHFEGRIQVYESFNEPDNWFLHSPAGLVQSPPLQADTFAELVDAVYDEVKGDGAYGDVLLLTGPLVGHDNGGFSAAANYLASAIQHGEMWLGWQAGAYPFDGVGYHVYVQQGTNNGFGVQASVAASLDAMRNMLVAEIGVSEANLRGDLCISELGWATPGVSDEVQRDALETTFNYLRGQSWRVRMASWYQVGDTPSEGGFGLIRPNYMHSDEDPTRFKLGWTEFQEQAALSAP